MGAGDPFIAPEAMATVALLTCRAGASLTLKRKHVSK
jgi:hypothetical protein